MGIQSLKYLIWKLLYKTVPTTLLYKLSHYKSHLLHGGHRYWVNLKNPQTFNEKIIWLKRYHRFDLGPIIKTFSWVKCWI